MEDAKIDVRVLEIRLLQHRRLQVALGLGIGGLLLLGGDLRLFGLVMAIRPSRP